MESIAEKYHKYIENVKKANIKYQKTHRESINAKAKEYYHEKLKHNSEYVERRREQARAYYYKKKGLNNELSQII